MVRMKRESAHKIQTLVNHKFCVQSQSQSEYQKYKCLLVHSIDSQSDNTQSSNPCTSFDNQQLAIKTKHSPGNRGDDRRICRGIIAVSDLLTHLPRLRPIIQCIQVLGQTSPSYNF